MDRNSYTDRNNVAIKMAENGELQLYAPCKRREINCKVAIIVGSPY